MPENNTETLPKLFKILHDNMTRIAPTGCSYEDDLQLWMDYVTPLVRSGEVRFLLMYMGKDLAGYFQYRIEDDILWADEVEIRAEYQRTKLFYRFCIYLLSCLPTQVRYIISYVRKENHNSIGIHEHLGMERIGENPSGSSWCYRGELDRAAEVLRRIEKRIATPVCALARNDKKNRK